MIIWQCIFWLCVLLIMHSYLLFPWLLQILASNKKENNKQFTADELPSVTVIMSVYNERGVLREKLDSLFASNYPANKLNILIGSDASDDGTGEILNEYQKVKGNMKAILYKERRGKPTVINSLMKEVKDEIVIMTDAKVIFHPDTVRGLTAHFKNESIGIVGGNIVNESIQKDGVSIQEKAFMSREILMKYREGLIWGSTIGVYGAIYAIRKNLYSEVPEGYSVDDFFITMEVLRKKHKAILDINVLSYEDVPNLISEEYRRKVRIATGNYQNMRYFFRELLTPWKGRSFAYISHKAIRWTGPFIFALFILSNVMLFQHHILYAYALYGALAVVVLSIIDFFLSKIGIHIVFLRFVRHFTSMNVALFQGFINNIRGVKAHVWRPTER
jgi:cellulose synthase/poly-beta-1,6-N-acetylglucosamine synthase-like glycosyltransferase